MIYIEEYEIEVSDIDELIKIYDESKKIFDELKLPYIKNYTVYQSTENPGKLRGIVIYDETGNTERLTKDYMSHPKAQWVVENIMKIIKNVVMETYTELYPF